MTATARILVVEDDRALRELLEEELSDAGYAVTGAASAEAAWQVQRESGADLIVSDLRLPGAGAIELLHGVGTEPNPPGFIIITAFGTISQAVEAIKAGADEFLTKPLDLPHLLVRVERALETRRLRSRLKELEALIEGDAFHGMMGRSPPMRAIFDAIRHVAPGDGPVLITGESGTGKELVARAVHAESRRAGAPFVAINCAGVPGELLESEFFGHVKGAFTGAAHRRRGLLQEARGGTVFLDEIAEMSVALQAKLLRVLEEGAVRPVGSDQAQPSDVRIVAATNRDLGEAVDRGHLRADLYYRLETFHLHVPPLREREGDVELLAMRFLGHFAGRLERRVDTIEPAALRALIRYRFPGNVRELANVIERAVTFCPGGTLRLGDLPERVAGPGGPAPPPGSLPTTSELLPLEAVEHHYIAHVLEQCGGNKRRAAEILGIGRRTLYRKLALHGENGEPPDPR